MNMTDTRRKHVRNRKHNNKVRRYCRWKLNNITVDEYYGQFLFDLSDALKQFMDAFSSFAIAMAEIAEKIQEIKEAGDGTGGD